MTKPITLANINFSFSANKPIVQDFNFTFQKRITALCGHNGSGKSTLLQILAGLLDPVTGTIYPSNVRAGYLPQGDTNDFPKVYLNREPVSLSAWGNMSKGECALAQLHYLIRAQPEILLLDEPDNHLDSSSRERLVMLMQRFGNPIVMATHSRAMLEQANLILFMLNAEVKQYGSYADYCTFRENEKAAIAHDFAQLQLTEKKHAKRAAEILQKKQNANDRAAVKNRTAGIPKVMQGIMKGSGEKTLANLRRVHERKHAVLVQELGELRKKVYAEGSPIDFLVSAQKTRVQKSESAILSGQGIQMLVRGKPLWQNSLQFQVSQNQKIALVGQNGTGKSTLARIIAGQEKASGGSVFSAPNAAALFSLDTGDLAHFSVLKFYQQNFPVIDEGRARKQLGALGFAGEAVFKNIGELSGGEKVRLLLHTFIERNHNLKLLVLDEPEVHLDLNGRERLAQFLGSIPIACVMITHDDYVARLFRPDTFWHLSETGLVVRQS